ncbi:MAG: amidohydrolase family protein [Lentisphaeria bacterium]|jgi:predicted TIM-barrel fold metal-dependent hydrolase|nr:amidohydrolase family protein [Lentisphaeria bacterium]MDY0175389.1 amidohydrolase family protein [Lentisphaeria bacterium]
MPELDFFDCNCRFGSAAAGEAAIATLSELLAEMDYYGVRRALIRHNNLDKGALSSNALLAEALTQKHEARLVGACCILPAQCEEIPEPEEFFAWMRQSGMRALTLSPFEHRYLPNRLTLGKMLDAASERKVPVLLNAFAGKWPELYAFLQEFPKLTCIYVESVGKWGSDRNIRPLLENYQNFYFETSGYWVPEGIADLVEKYGNRRILYGSGLPRYNQGSSMLQLRHSGMDAISMAKVAGENLEYLLQEAEI